MPFQSNLDFGIVPDYRAFAVVAALLAGLAAAGEPPPIPPADPPETCWTRDTLTGGWARDRLTNIAFVAPPNGVVLLTIIGGVFDYRFIPSELARGPRRRGFETRRRRRTLLCTCQAGPR